jgi:hypothetical protein
MVMRPDSSGWRSSDQDVTAANSLTLDAPNCQSQSL